MRAVTPGHTVCRFVLVSLTAAVPVFAQTPPAAPTSPMSLSTALSTAMQQVSAFRQAEIDEQIAAEDLRQARAALLPRARDSFTITYNSRAPGTNNPTFIASNAVHEYQNLIGVTGDLGVGMFAAVRRSRALLEAARAGTDIARRALVRGVSEAYYGAALATAKRRAADQSLAAAQEFERVTDLNYQAGEVPEVDAIRARLQTAARREDLANALQAEAIANASLGTLLGAGITNAVTIEPLPQTIDPREVESLAIANIPRRPEFRQLEAQVRAAEADIGVSRGELLPHITYSVDTGFDTDMLNADVLREHKGILATANVNIPIFDWGLSFSKVRQAQMRARGARLQHDLVIRDLYLQYATARQEAMTAAERVDNARSAVADAERNMEISISRYRAGEGTIVEATDALNQLATQRLALQQSLFDYQIALAHLMEAVGQ